MGDTDTPKKRSRSEDSDLSSPEVASKKVVMDDTAMDNTAQNSLSGDSSSDMDFLKRAILGIQTSMTALQQTCDNSQSTITEVKETLNSLTGRVHNVEQECNQLRENVNNSDMKMKKCMHEMDSIKGENRFLKGKMKELEERAIKAESYSRRDNLILDGIPLAENENLDEIVRDIFTNKMKCVNVQEMKFVRVHRLANKKKVIVKFHYFQDKEHVWSKRRELKGKKIWIEEDYPPEIRNRRQILRPIFKAAQNVDGMRASLTGDQLRLNGDVYTVDNLHQLPPALKLHQTSLVTHEECVYFYTRSSPLSNFFPAKFTLHGVVYNCVEQYYQAEKATSAGDYKAYDSIMVATQPEVMHAIGKKVKVDTERWTEGMQRLVMEKALVAKFNDNPYLADVLLSTGENTLVEASPYDDFWGAGMGLKDILKSNKWTGKNVLGEIMMSVRGQMK